jgi:putative ABC transport system ATP-binding protein
VLEVLRGQVKQHGAAGILVTHSESAAATCDRQYWLSMEGLRLI